jgi:hypothetical protein
MIFSYVRGYVSFFLFFSFFFQANLFDPHRVCFVSHPYMVWASNMSQLQARWLGFGGCRRCHRVASARKTIPPPPKKKEHHIPGCFISSLPLTGSNLKENVRIYIDGLQLFLITSQSRPKCDPVRGYAFWESPLSFGCGSRCQMSMKPMWISCS